MAGMKRFRRKWIAVNPLNPTVLCVPQHQTIVQSKMTLASGRVLQFQCRQKSSNLQNNAHNTYKAYNRKNKKIIRFLILKLNFNSPTETQTQVNRLLRKPADRWAKDVLMITGV